MRMTTVKGNRDLILLLVISGLYLLATAISNLFVNLFLWRQSHHLSRIAYYNLAVVIAQTSFYWLAGLWAKRVDRVILFRFGIFILALFYIVILLLQSGASQYVFLLGLILGAGYGFYWLSYHLLTFEITEPETRDFFNGVAGILYSLANMVGPFLAGAIVEATTPRRGYSLLFLISFTLFALAVVASWFLHRRPREHIPFAFKEVWREGRRNWRLRKLLRAHVAQGWREGGVLFLLVIWVFTILGRERGVGLFMLLQSLFSMGGYLVWSRGWYRGSRWKCLFWAGLLSYVVLVAFFFWQVPIMVYIYAISIGILFPFIDVPYRSYTYDAIGEAKQAGPWRIEYLQLRDLFTNLGRLCALVLLLLLLPWGRMEQVLPWYIVLVGGGYWLIALALAGAVDVKGGEMD